MLNKEILPGNRIETTNAFLDISWPKEDPKICPESNEHTDSEISSLLWADCAILSRPQMSHIFPVQEFTLRAKRLYESYLHFCGPTARFFHVPNWARFPSARVLLYEPERALRVMCYHSWGLSAFLARKPPAGPPKLRNMQFPWSDPKKLVS